MSEPSVEESSSIEAEIPAEAGGESSAGASEAPLLSAVFVMLCRAMIEQLEDDLPSQLHVEEILGWHANGNVGIAWAHAILILEQVIGVRLRG